MYQRINIKNAEHTQVRCEEITSLPLRRKVPRPENSDDQKYDETAGHLVVKLVSILEQVDIDQIHCSSRGKADVCLSRQKAMYLMHTVFSSPYYKVAKFFKRDRTTIAHACALIEDLRDNQEFDKQIEAMENLLVSARAFYEIAGDVAGNE